jgi:hypothetical protein
MIPKPFNQKQKYNELILPKEHRESAQRASTDIWNELTKINQAYPNDEIVIEYFLRDMGKGLYSIDMRLSCDRIDVQQHLNQAYERYMQLPRFVKPQHLTDEELEFIEP